LCPIIDTAKINKKEILKYAKENGKRPSASDKNPEIRKLGNACSNYSWESSRSFDPEFRKELLDLLKKD